MLETNEVKKVFDEADCLYDDNQVQQALGLMASSITNELRNDNPLFLAVVSGAMIPIGHL